MRLEQDYRAKKAQPNYPSRPNVNHQASTPPLPHGPRLRAGPVHCLGKHQVRPEETPPTGCLRSQVKDGLHQVLMTRINMCPPTVQITDDSSPTRISEPNCATVNRLNYWPAKGHTRHRRTQVTQLTQLDAHPSLPLPYRPSSGGSPPTRSPLPSCTRAHRRHQAGPRLQHGTTKL